MTFDYEQARSQLDPQDMFGAITDFPEHFREGWIRAADLVPRHRIQDIDHVVIIGMGGSAIGGDLLRAYALYEATLPITVVRDYQLPEWVNKRTLVIASSYSGDTEETLAAVGEATEREASIYVVTTGGELHDLAKKKDFPHVTLTGGMQPRAALGHSFAALLRIADKLGLVDVADTVFEDAYSTMQARAKVLGSPAASRAAEIAGTLHGRLTVVYTGPSLLAPVGVRWVNQIQENAKQMAYGNVFAELDHNEIMGWEHAPSALRQQIGVIALRDPADHPQIHRRIDVTRDLIAGRAATWIEHHAEGDYPLTRMLTTLQLGDFVSFYLAMRVGVDPTPVETIQQFKRTLADA